MIRAFEIDVDDYYIEVFVSRISSEIWQSLGRVGGEGWLVSIPTWKWSTYVNDEQDLFNIEFWIRQLGEIKDKHTIELVAREIAKRC